MELSTQDLTFLETDNLLVPEQTGFSEHQCTYVAQEIETGFEHVAQEIEAGFEH